MQTLPTQETVSYKKRIRNLYKKLESKSISWCRSKLNKTNIMIKKLIATSLTLAVFTAPVVNRGDVSFWVR
jgi:hypothetical protein